MIEQTKTVWSRVFEAWGHVDTFRRARESTQITIAALGHINVELGDMEALLMARGRFLDLVGYGFDGFNRNALHWAGAFALGTADAIVHIHKQLHARVGWEFPTLLGILQGHGGGKKPPPCEAHTYQGGFKTLPDIDEILQHTAGSLVYGSLSW